MSGCYRELCPWQNILEILVAGRTNIEYAKYLFQ